MCGRYAFAPQKNQQEQELKDIWIPEMYEARYNIAPTEKALVLTNEASGGLQWMEWGLVPHWSNDGVNNGKLINARGETIFEKPSFREAILFRRCLAPADSFYEWRKDPAGKKIPYRIQRNNGELLWMAGIWDSWGLDERRTFSIITTEPNEEMSALHHRMPVLLLHEQDRRDWLNPKSDSTILKKLMQKPPDHCLHYYRIGQRINSAGADDPSLQIPVPENPDLFGNNGF